MGSRNLYTLKDAIEQLLNTYRLKGKLQETNLIESWEKVCGSLISRHTENLFVSNNKLYVKVDSAALKNELMYSKTKLVSALNKSVGDEIIKDIVFI